MMNARIATAIFEAYATASAALAASDTGQEALLSRNYFVAVAHQRLFCTLCGADPTTHEGGTAKTGGAILHFSKAMVASWKA